jgi:hypothetical protein
MHEGDDLQVCRVAANILRKQQWTADERWLVFLFGSGSEDAALEVDIEKN